MDWIKILSKDHPKFWEKYIANFSSSNKNSNRFIVFDCATTGTDFENDRIFSISGIAVVNNQIIVSDFIEIIIQQDMMDHEFSKLTIGKEEKFVEAEAIIRFLDFIKDATLVGHNVDFDIEMINQALRRLHLGTLKNEIMDINIMNQKINNDYFDVFLNLDELCDLYKVSKTNNYTAHGNAFIIALLFLKLSAKLRI